MFGDFAALIRLSTIGSIPQDREQTMEQKAETMTLAQ